jgi:serine/threonine protein kinase
MALKTVLGWVGSLLGKSLAEGCGQVPLMGIYNLLQQHTQTTKDIEAALEASYQRALTSLEIALKGPALWSKTAHKEFSLTFEAEVMGPFCQNFAAEEELRFRKNCLADIKKLREKLPSLWGTLGSKPIAEGFALSATISNRDQVALVQRQAGAELAQTLEQILGAEAAILKLIRFRNVLLDGIRFHFMDLVKEKERLRVHLDILQKKALAREMSQEHLEVLGALEQVGAKHEQFFGAMAQQLQTLSQAAQKIELTLADMRQDCSELKAGQAEILCGVEMMLNELRDMKMRGSQDVQELLELQTHQALLTGDYRLAGEGYQKLAHDHPQVAGKYNFLAMAAGILQQIRRGGHNFRPLVESFQSTLALLPPAQWMFKECRLDDFLEKGPLTLRFLVNWQGQTAELVALSPLLALRKNPDLRNRFRRTLDILEKLAACPFIPKILAANLAAEIPYYLTSWTEGEPLSQYLEHNKLGWEAIWKLVVRVAQMLQAIHDKEVALRVFTIHHLFYTPPQEIVLRGLELAKDQDMLDLTETDAGLTILAGLPHYAKGSQFSLAADIAAFGHTMAYLCTQSECPTREQFPKPWLYDLFARCTHVEPQQRYFFMSEVVEQLESAHVTQRARTTKSVANQHKRIAAEMARTPSQSYVQLETIEGNEPQPNIFYEHDTLLAGRSDISGCHIFQDSYASRLHCILEINPPQCSVRDMGSRNGTYVNGKKYGKGEQTPLRDGDLLKIGHTTLKIRIIEPSGATTAASETLSDASEEPLVYQREALIAQEGPWHIYHALHPETQARVRLKVAVDQGSFSAARLKKFLSQVKFLKELDHPHIARFYSGGYDDKELYLATEWVEGETLWQHVKTAGTLALGRAKHVMQQLCSALSYAHEQGIVHRRIHPKWLCVDAQERLKIIDFGLSCHFEMAGLSGLSLYEEKDEDMLYTAPEQIQDYRTVDLRSDIYAAGAVFFYLLTGQPIFAIKDRDPMSVVLDGQIAARKVGELLPDIEPHIEELIARCLEKDPAQRWQNVGEMVENL